MLEQQPCAGLIEVGKHIWLYAVSDEGHMVFGIVATARAIIYYLKRINTRESRELASAIKVALCVGLIIVATDRLAPRIYAKAGVCEVRGAKISKAPASD